MASNIQLHIPEPCHENWDNMTPADKGRFCSSCQKEVVDFSIMTDREMAQFFKRPATGSVCGHFSNSQLDRDIAIPKKRIPWLKYFFQVAIPAFLVSMKSNAQTRGIVDVTVCIPDKQPMKGAVAYIETPVFFKGIVVNAKGDPLPFATIKIKSTGQQVLSDINGEFKIKTPANKAVDQLTIMYVAYSPVVVSITAADWQRGTTTITLQNMDMMVDGMIIPVKRMPKPTIIDTVKNLFTSSKISPSPVDQGNAFVVEWKCRIDEKIYVRVTGANDKVMLFVPFDAMKGNNRVPVNTDATWIPGKYTVQLLAINGKQLMVERVAVRLRQTDLVEKISPDHKPSQLNVVKIPEIPEQSIVAIVGGVNVVTVEKEKHNWITDTIKTILPVFTASKISPNPMAQGQTFMIDWKSKTEEKIYIKITGIDGKELMSIPVTVSKGNNRLPVNTDTNWLPGTYVVNLFDVKGKQLLSEKIIIQ
jgi:hypothetical protein